MSSNTSLQTFKAALENISELPYCSGTSPLDANSATLFYRTGDSAQLIDFTHPTEVQLSALAKACQQATFGVNQKDVLDESYRKAGKMDASDFATQFSPQASGLIDTVHNTLLEGPDIERSIRAELYKLNVYGPDSFFKAHVDTPRSDTMCGSLVVIFPTAHEGGSLIMRHRGQEHKFDTAHAVSSHNSPHVAYVAFFSDVEHEVSVVTSGYRVTLTYNLYFSEHPSPDSALGILPENNPLNPLKTALSVLLADPTFLPEGGLLGFGLSHKYPFNPLSTKISDLDKRLKGSDAAIRRISKALSLDIRLKAIYNTNKSHWSNGYAPNVSCLVDDFADLGRGPIEDEDINYIHDRLDGALVYDKALEIPRQQAEWKGDEPTPIVWINTLHDPQGSFKQAYFYGNESSLDYTYGDVCLVAEIGTLQERNLVKCDHLCARCGRAANDS